MPQGQTTLKGALKETLQWRERLPRLGGAMAQSMKGLLLMSLMFQGAGLFIKWRGWVHRVEGGLEGVRVFTFSLLLPFLLFRSTWASALEPSLVLWFFWAVGFHALWTATTYAAYAYGHGLRGRDLGWSLLMSNGVALGFAYSLLGAASCGRDEFREFLAGETMKHRYRHAW